MPVKNKYMELSKQVCSLELSKKLKELGFKQESEFEHIKIERKFNGESSFRWIIKYCEEKFDEYDEPLEFINAYTVAELGEILPDEIKTKNNKEIFGDEEKTRYIGFDFYEEQVNNNYGVRRVYRVSIGGKQFEADTEADARAKMLIYLKENKLI